MELPDFDLRDPGPAVVQVLRDAVDRHHAVLDAGQHQELAERFGSIVRSPVHNAAAATRADEPTRRDHRPLGPAGLTTQGRAELKRTYAVQLRKAREHAIDRIDPDAVPIMLDSLERILEGLQENDVQRS